MPIRLIALDIDGTLLDSRWQVPEANRRAIAAATSRGIEVVLVTGRRFDFTRAVTDQLSNPVTLIVNNGALVKTPDGETLLRHLLPCDVASLVLAGTPGFRAGAALVFDRPREDQVIFERFEQEDPHVRRYIERNRQFVGIVAPLEASLTEDPIQIMYAGSLGLMRELIAILRALSVADRFAVAVTEYEDRAFSLVDVIRQGCSKGATLAEWAERQGIHRNEVLAIGDNLNDREMLEFAGWRVVMGNAAPEMKSLGWPLTLTNDEAGVAATIDALVLKE